jgi:hypothetical protein
MLGFYCLLALFDICWENRAGDATDWELIGALKVRSATPNTKNIT